MNTYNAVLPAPTLRVGARTVSFAIGICCDGADFQPAIWIG